MSDANTADSVPGGQAGDQSTTGAGSPDPHGGAATGAGSAAAKDSDQWVTGEEPMTGPQASYLETLAQQAGERVPEGLTKARASDEIERLQGRAGGAGGGPGGSSGAGGAGGSGPAGPPDRPTDTWVTGEEPMTGPQASYLETLAQQAGREVPTGLTKSEASRAIDELRSQAVGNTGTGSSSGSDEAGADR